MLNDMLPGAVRHERQTMLADSVELLRRQGYEELYVNEAIDSEDDPVDEEDFATRQPDIIACHPLQPGPLVGVVEPSAVLGEENCGRRWRDFANWARAHHGQLMVFVHPDDVVRAAQIARHWHVDPGILVPMADRLH